MLYSEYLARRIPSKLQTFQEGKAKSQGLWYRILDELLRISTIHGWRRIFSRTSKTVERFLWSFGFSTALLIFFSVSYNIAFIYRYKPFRTVISDLQLPVYKIPFPEVIICNQNRFNWQRFEEAKERFLHAQHRTVQHERVFLEAVAAYDTLEFGKFDNFRNLSYLYPRILLRDLNYVNFTLVAELMAWRCHEIFTECTWMEQPFDCCEIFSARKSQMGQCLAFNSIETEEGIRKLSTDRYYPWRTRGSGPENGLNLRIHIREELHSPLYDNFKGVMVMLVEPEVWGYVFHDIPTNTRALVSISSFLHFHDEYTRIFSSPQRRCVFQDERESLYYKSLPNHKYNFENCHAACQQEYLKRDCNCTFDLFYPPGPYRSCSLMDFPCLYAHNQKLQNVEQIGERDVAANHIKGMNCPCFYSCKSLRYRVDINIDHVSKEEIDINSTEIEMSVYFLVDTLMVYKTSVVYTIVDLMASVGGLAGLCMGCSLVGIIEFVYFFIIDIPKQGISNRRCKPNGVVFKRRKALKMQQILVKQISLP